MVGGRSLFVLSIRPFDAGLYEDEGDDDSDVLDEDGRARLKLKVENTIRWRKRVNEDGEEVKESNTRIVRWSDGRWVSLVDHVTGILTFFFSSMSLYLGGEIFDIHCQPLQREYSHLFIRQGKKQ